MVSYKNQDIIDFYLLMTLKGTLQQQLDFNLLFFYSCVSWLVTQSENLDSKGPQRIPPCNGKQRIKFTLSQSASLTKLKGNEVRWLLCLEQWSADGCLKRRRTLCFLLLPRYLLHRR